MLAVLLTGFGGPEVLEVRDDVADPAPGPGQVLVEVSAAALNNTDIWTREGAYGTADDPSARAGWRGPIVFPRIQGGDVAGHVRDVGDGVDGSWVGRRVLVDPALYDSDRDDAHPVGLLGSEFDGGFARYTVVAADRVHDVTASPLSDVQLAGLPVAYGTATGMLERAAVSTGDTVLVTGASGGVGFAAVQLAAARGADVLAVSTAAKADEIRAAGARVVLDRDADDVPAVLREHRPRGVDVVADVVGGPPLVGLVPALTEGGRVVVAGALAGPVVELDLRRLYLHNRALIGSSMHTPRHFARLVDDAAAGRIQPRIAATHPLSELRRAQEQFVERGHVGKIVVQPDR